ncbi:MAG: hypothetical protein LBH76_02550 [Propionibacteriaceae bacterium]|jgi:hypothetical protein|nr:hypothetical protein [Propionibacteriaceae bacterium]
MTAPLRAWPGSAAPRRRRPWLRVVVGLGVVLAVGAAGFAAFQYLYPKSPNYLPPTRCQAELEDGSTAYIDIEQSENASLIAGVAAQRGLVPRAVSIALATAFQESKIRNLDYGDLDSLGLFQQRPSAGWGTPEEIMDPYYSTNKFFDAMVMVPDWAGADIGDVAQEVQRSAFPDAYDQHVARARLLASALSGETAAGWSCLVRDARQPDPAGLAEAIVRAYGHTLAVVASTPAREGGASARIEFTAADEPVAWSAAAFVQSWATAKGVHSVQVGGRLWTGQSAELAPWTAADEPVGPTQLVVVFDAPPR